jgi:diguanylate cyclase (GGDEF)-like protein
VQPIKEVLKDCFLSEKLHDSLSIFIKLGQAFTLPFEKEEIFFKTYELISSVMDIDILEIALYDEEEGIYSPPFILLKGKRTDSHDNKYFHTQSSVSVPMFLGNQLKGVISVHSPKSYGYNTNDKEILQIIAIHLANALENASIYTKVYELSMKDDLTLVKNRRAFHQDLDRLMNQSQITGKSISLMMIDSDNLKQVNDLFGHHVGDAMIRSISQTLTTILNGSENVYRYAGDEFMVVIGNGNLEEVQKKAFQIQNYLREHPFKCEDKIIPITVSIGISCYPELSGNAFELQRTADKALYISKENGKNQVTIFNGAS